MNESTLSKPVLMTRGTCISVDVSCKDDVTNAFDGIVASLGDDDVATVQLIKLCYKTSLKFT